MRVIAPAQIVATGPQAISKVESENPSVYFLANVGAFSATIEISHDGVTWFNSGIAAVNTLGVVQVPGRIVYLRLQAASVTTSLDVVYVV